MRLVLDEHLPLAVALALRRRGADVVALRDWQDGVYLGAADDRLLEAAFTDGRVLVTFDCSTIPPLLKQWAEIGRDHAGVVLVDEITLRPSDVGGLVRSLAGLLDERGPENWQDRVAYLRPA